MPRVKIAGKLVEVEDVETSPAKPARKRKTAAKPSKNLPAVTKPKAKGPPPDIEAPDKGGRHFVCTGPVRRALIVSAQTGLHRSDVAIDVGIHIRSLERLLVQAHLAIKKEERGLKMTEWEQELCRFCRGFLRAELEAKKKLVRTVMDADTPKDALATLGQRWPQQWAKRTMLGNIPDEDEDGQPTGKPGTLTVSADPITKLLIKDALARRGKPTEILTPEG